MSAEMQPEQIRLLVRQLTELAEGAGYIFILQEPGREGMIMNHIISNLDFEDRNKLIREIWPQL